MRNIRRKRFSNLAKDDTLEEISGDRFGLIKFGSCTEIFLPPNVEVTVGARDKVRGGETIIGRVKIDER